MSRYEILWINLDRDIDRRNWMVPQLEQLGRPSRRISGLTPETIPPEIKCRFAPNATELLLPGNIACFSSHILIAQEVVEGAYNAVVVLEDDVEVQCTGDELDAIVEASAKLDIVKLNDWPKAPTKQLAAPAGRQLVRYLRVPRGTGAYILTRTGAARFLERAHNIATSTDNFVRAEGALALRIGGVIPPPILQDQLPGSSLDPLGQRNKARNRKYVYSPFEGNTIYNRLRWHVGEFGLTTWVRMSIANIMMRIRRVKADKNGRYVIK